MPRASAPQALPWKRPLGRGSDVLSGHGSRGGGRGGRPALLNKEHEATLQQRGPPPFFGVRLQPRPAVQQCKILEPDGSRAGEREEASAPLGHFRHRQVDERPLIIP